MRADAQRNRAAILAAARELIARDGVDITMEELAARATVAVGTLYRHFPTKTALVAAVLDESVASIAELAEAALADHRAGRAAEEALGTLFRQVAAAYATDAGVKKAAASLGVAIDLDALTRQTDGPAYRATAAIAQILGAGQRSGRIRSDLTVEDLVMLVSSAPGAEASRRAREQYLAVVLAGIIRPGRPES